MENYPKLLSHIAAVFVTYFLINAISGLVDYLKLKNERSLWHVGMSLSIGIYTFFLGINTHIESSHISNSILLCHWIVSYLALFCYLNAIEFYLERKLVALLSAKIVFLSISAIYFVSAIAFQFIGESPFLKQIPTQLITNYSRYSHITTMGSTLGTVIGAFGIVMIVFSSVIVWRELGKSENKETVLKFGIILCLITGSYDTAIGLGYLKTALPLFYLAFALESIRLTLHNKNLVSRKMKKLNIEIIKLTKIAQFGLSTASISHDIKNHLFIINSKLRRLSRTQQSPDIDIILKHTKEIDNVTNLYTDLFKKNLEAKELTTDIVSIINNTKDLLNKKVEKHRIKISYRIDSNFEFKCNETELTLCLVNLVNNSIEEVSSLKDKWIIIDVDSNLRKVSVIDSGYGHKNIDEDKIFQYGHTTKKDEGGTGIGLAVAQKLLRKSGHDLYFEKSAVNTTFVIKLN